MAQDAETTRDTVSARFIPAEGGVRVGPLRKLPELVRELGCDPTPVFAAAGFDVSRFEDPDNEISYISGSRLIARCVAETGCHQLGLLLGERTEPSALGVAGFMLKSAPDIGSALRGLVRHLDLHDRGAVATLNIQGDYAQFGYAIHLPGVEAAEQIYDLSIAVVCRIMRSLCGDEWNPSEVHLSRKKPSDPKPYRHFFRAPLLFETHQSVLIFPSRWLKQPIASADPLLHRYLEREAGKLHATHPTTLVGELHRLLRASLTGGRHGVADIAKQLGMHERTLNRRLREEGTSFRRELDVVRYEMARQLLSSDSMFLSQIAEALDYGDTAAFSRAFKRWSGIPPTDWRTDSKRS